MKKITILENDYIHENNPIDPVLNIFISKYKNIKFNVWDRFSFHISDDKKKVFEMIKGIKNPFLAYPSFVGYGNHIDGWIYFLNELRKQEIKLDLYIIYGLWESDGENLLYAVLKEYRHSLGDAKLELLEIIDYHDIKYIPYERVYLRDDNNLFEMFEKLTSESVKKLFFQKGDVVEVEEGKGEVLYAFYSGSSHYDYVDVKVGDDILNKRPYEIF